MLVLCVVGLRHVVGYNPHHILDHDIWTPQDLDPLGVWI